MIRWKQIRQEIESSRSARREDWCNRLIVQIKRAAEMDVCDKLAQYRVKKDGRLIEIKPQQGMTVVAKKREVPAIGLKSLPALENAKLTFRVFLSADERRVEQYTLTVVGKERASGRAWYVRVDLDEEQKGQGPCGHPILHGHVGVDPNEDGAQESRVPLPWLGPDEALAWVLATVHQKLEP